MQKFLLPFYFSLSIRRNIEFQKMIDGQHFPRIFFRLKVRYTGIDLHRHDVGLRLPEHISIPCHLLTTW